MTYEDARPNSELVLTVKQVRRGGYGGAQFMAGMTLLYSKRKRKHHFRACDNGQAIDQLMA